MMKRICVLCVFYLTFSNAYSHNKVVIIPMFEAEQEGIANIVTVAKHNGDFNTVERALNSITDASNANPYVIYVGPGRFSVRNTLRMKRYVSIKGSGKDTTTLTGRIDSQSFIRGCGISKAIILSENDSSISNLAIENTGTSGNTMIGICNGGGNFISDVTIRVKNGSTNYGIFSQAEDHLSLDHSSVFVTGLSGSRNYGVFLNATDANIDEAFISAGGSSRAISAGVFANELSNVKISDSRISGLSSLKLEDGSSITVANSLVSGQEIFVNPVLDTASTPSKLVIRTSTVIGNITGGGLAICLYSDDGDSPLNQNCGP